MFNIEEIEPTQEDIDLLKHGEERVKKARDFVRKNFISLVPANFDRGIRSMVTEGEITEEEYKEKIHHQREKVVRSIDGFYNYRTFIRGALDKFVEATFEINAETIVDYVLTLHAIGLNVRQIFYCVCKGTRENKIPIVVTFWHVRNILAQFDGSRVKREFQKSLTEHRMQVFQQLHKEMQAEEEKTLILYIKKIGTLNDALNNTDPVSESTKFNKIVGMIQKLQTIVNDAHGINDSRKGVIAAATEAMKQSFSLRLKAEDPNANVVEAFGKIIEAGSSPIEMALSPALGDGERS